MSKHMILWTEGDQDDVEVFHKEPTIVVIARRTDLEVLKNLDEAKKAGVYFLMNENFLRYVGQASGSVYSRITTHEKNKDWWTSLVFFGRLDGHLDKSQLDYLENKLIRMFEEKGFHVDNQTAGNSSYISQYQRGQAESLLSEALNILEHTAKLDVLKRPRAKRGVGQMAPTAISFPVAASVLPKIFTIKDNTGRIASGSSRKSAYISYLQDLKGSPGVLTSLRQWTEDCRGSLFREKTQIEPPRMRFYTYLDNDIYIFHNLSADGIKENLLEIGKRLNLQIELIEP